LASNEDLTKKTERQNTYQRKLTIHKKGPNKQHYNRKHDKGYNKHSWFSCLLRYSAKKLSGSILTTPEPAWGGRYNGVSE